MTNLEFFNMCAKFKSTINALGATAQCSHETRVSGKDWNSPLYLKSYNPAGIKTLTGWKGEYINSATWEQSTDGKIATSQKYFLKFNSAADGLEGYVEKIKQNYPKCNQNVDNVFGYFSGLLNGKYGSWATDLNYIDRLIESLVRVSPVCLGDGWKNRLKTALDFAISNKRVSSDEAYKFKTILYKNLGETVVVADKVEINKTVVIDPGHGLPDPGSVGYNGNKEMNIVLLVAKKLKSKLENVGIKVILTRSTDNAINTNKSKDLLSRSAVSNTAKADVFVSIHCNAANNRDASGFEAFTTFGKTKADDLCTLIYNKWVVSFPSMKIRTGGTSYGKGKEDGYVVLVNTKAPAVLVELGFISNLLEEKLLASDDFQNKAAETIKDSILEFLMS